MEIVAPKTTLPTGWHHVESLDAGPRRSKAYRDLQALAECYRREFDREADSARNYSGLADSSHWIQSITHGDGTNRIAAAVACICPNGEWRIYWSWQHPFRRLHHAGDLAQGVELAQAMAGQVSR
ncbi:hypothetical protein [Rosistilla oblonga]|uniref:Uncharacterized protein n=1 Tax=Rosistilla oblonga TaxID=2527990 RepID=A0A518IQW0_9BACT|nr:hypothetical protein [Rosistilla oblonga]QDV55482.1 hypothetical protein Mal33_14570 [Rosistilla oblonga]